MSAEPVVPIALSWLLTYVVHSTLLIVVIALVTRCLPRAAMGAREALCKLALVGGLGTASIQLACSTEPWFGRMPVAAPAAIEAGEPAQAPDTLPREAADRGADGTIAPAEPSEFSLVEHAPAEASRMADAFASRERGGPRALLESALLAVPTAATPTSQSAPRVEPIAALERELDAPALYVAGALDGSGAAVRALFGRAVAQDWRALVLAAWIAGAALGLASLARSWRRLHRALRWRTPLEAGALRAELDALCDECGHRGRVRLSCASGISAPVAFGALRPEICVPVRAIAKLTPGQQRGMLAHELAHVRRRDPSWLLFTRVLEALLFVQPLNRLARRGIEDASEYLCDDFAARRGGGLALANCLAEIAGWLVPGAERRALQLAVGMARQPSRLTHRIERLLVEEEREERLLWLAPVGLCACTLLVFVAPGFAPGHALEPRVLEQPESDELALDATELAPPSDAESDAERSDAARASEDDASDDDDATPSGGMRDALGALDLEIETLAEEVDALRADLDARHLTRRFAAQIATLEQRLNELSTRRARLREVLGLLSALDAAAPAAPLARDTDPLSAPGAAAKH